MPETEPQLYPENYFHADVAGLAQFIIYAADAGFAELRLREYCKENPFLKLDPDAHFDVFNTIQQIPSEETVQYRKTQLDCNIVRLVGYLDLDWPIPSLKVHQRNMALDAPKQLDLF